MANYNFVIDSHYKPYSLQELLVPYGIYKEAFEKTEQMSYDLADKSDMFKYLSTTLPADSKARQIYENYANDLAAQAAELNRHGLTMTTSAGISDMRRRYKGEIGMLEKADEQLQKVLNARREAMLKDPTMMYATNNLTIDSYLNGKFPNEYGVSGDYLYQKGIVAGTANAKSQVSAGDVGTVIQNLYNDFVTTQGYSPEKINQFRAGLIQIPELQQAIDNILVASGVPQNIKDPATLQRARLSVMNGIVDGALGSYTQTHNPVRNGNPDWKEQQQIALGWRKQVLDEMQFKYQMEKDARDAAAQAAGKDTIKAEWADNVVETPLRDRRDIEDAAKYAQYFEATPGGGYRLTKEGVEAYNARNVHTSWKKKNPYDVSEPYKEVKEDRGPSEFRLFMDKLGYKSSGNVSPEEAGRIWKNYQEGRLYDINRGTELKVSLSNSQGEGLAKIIWDAHPTLSGMSKTSSGYKSKGTYEYSDLENYIPSSVSVNKNGQIAITWMDKDSKETKVTNMPDDVNSAFTSGIKNAASKVYGTSEVLNSNYVPVIDKNTKDFVRDKDGHVVYEPSDWDRHSGAPIRYKNLSPDEINMWNDEYTAGKASMYYWILKLGQESEAETSKVK